MTARDRFSTALRTVAAATLVAAAGAVPVRLCAAAFKPFEPYPGHTADYGIPRPRAIRTALPAIADRPEKTAIVLGSSGVARAFVPAVFDEAIGRAGERHTSFNLAQMLLQPETALAMAREIQKAHEDRHKRIGVAIFGISVPELTRDALRAARRAMPDQAFVFASARGLGDRARTDPLGALGDGLELALFGDVRPERVGLWIEDWIRARPVGCDSGFKQPPRSEEAKAALASFCAELHRQFPRGVPPWNPDARGGLDFGLPATRPMLARLAALQAAEAPAPTPPAPPPGPAHRPLDEIDEGVIRTLIAAVRTLGAVSDDVFVLRDILNPALVAPFPADQIEAWRSVAERIAREGGATLLDFNDGTVTAADFGDQTHLNPLAAERFSSILADRVRAVVDGHRAPR